MWLWNLIKWLWKAGVEKIERDTTLEKLFKRSQNPLPTDEPPPTPTDSVPRAYIALTPYELWELVASKTKLEASLISQKFSGSWLRVPHAQTIDVSPEEDERITSVVESHGEPSIVIIQCQFDAALWRPHLQLCEVGDLLMGLEGQVVSIQDTQLALEPHIILEHCDFAEIKDPTKCL